MCVVEQTTYMILNLYIYMYNGCDTPIEDASFEDLGMSHFGFVLRQVCPELVIFLDFAFQISLGISLLSFNDFSLSLIIITM